MIITLTLATMSTVPKYSVTITGRYQIAGWAESEIKVWAFRAQAFMKYRIYCRYHLLII